jgi:hypothetical protein
MAVHADPTTFTSTEVVAAWLNALIEGLGPGRTFAAEITNLDGNIIERTRVKIEGRMQLRKEERLAPFDQAALDASTRVARDLGAICAIMADATRDKVVTVDVFERARELTKLHAACPTRPEAIGTGPYC